MQRRARLRQDQPAAPPGPSIQGFEFRGRRHLFSSSPAIQRRSAAIILRRLLRVRLAHQANRNRDPSLPAVAQRARPARRRGDHRGTDRIPAEHRAGLHFCRRHHQAHLDGGNTRRCNERAADKRSGEPVSARVGPGTVGRRTKGSPGHLRIPRRHAATSLAGRA